MFLLRNVITLILHTKEWFIPQDAAESITAPFLLRPVQEHLKLHLHRISKASSIRLICPFNLGVFNSVWKTKSQMWKQTFLIFFAVISFGFFCCLENTECKRKYENRWVREKSEAPVREREPSSAERRDSSHHCCQAKLHREARKSLLEGTPVLRRNVLKQTEVGQPSLVPDVQIWHVSTLM